MKKYLVSICTFIFMLFVGGCGNSVDKVETLTDWSFQYNEGTSDYSLMFGLQDKNAKAIAADVDVDIRIVNEEVFTGTKTVTTEDFGSYTN